MVELLSNPYEAVDWDAYLQVKSDHHYHTEKDNPPPHDMVDTLVDDLDYGILTFDRGTNLENGTMWPWTEWSTYEDGWEDRDPDTDFTRDVVAVQGMEQGTDHTLSLFSDLEPQDFNLTTWYNLLGEIKATGGLAVLEHPSRYTDAEGAVERWGDGFEDFPDTLIGFAAWNKDAGHFNAQGHHRYDDVESWDALLSHFMPERPIWAFSHDDPHGFERGHDLDVRYNTVAVEEMTTEAVRTAYEDGQLFAHSREHWADDTEAPPEMPTVNEIVVDESEPSITIDASGYESVRWICQGWVVGESETLVLTDEMDKYVRAELLTNPDAHTLTQPFGVDGDGPSFGVTSSAKWEHRSEAEWGHEVGPR
ncbi:hypothetical protein [Natronorarus salvus]|uniref:hypothetical protein n=1 Tax=Natronorarus salvus TaxID=3117733 RepID=UPI002F266928